MNNKKSIMKSIARDLRSNMTEPEQLIWYCIRKKQVDNVQFYRQKNLGPFIVDFYAPSIRLVIEVDGSQHFERTHCEQDIFRDNYLNCVKINVLRFRNYEVRHQMSAVLEKLYCVVQQMKLDVKV